MRLLAAARDLEHPRLRLDKFGWGPRLPETFFYIAETISCFDLVAVQEVSRDLSALLRVMDILGCEWDYIVTDTTEGAGGNGERMAFVYNTEKVWFRKVAGEVVLPDGQLVVGRKKARRGARPEVETAGVETLQQFARSPYLVAFQSGWFRFSLCTVHIYYGSETGDQLAQRVDEIRKLVGFFAKRQDSESPEKDRRGAVENYILLGDFNVVSAEHETMKALKDKGFKVPEAIDGRTVRKEGEHFYDQIAVRVKDQRFKVLGGGMVDIFADVFRDDAADMELYRPNVPERDPEKKRPGAKPPSPESLFCKWRTWQMSDHSPLWIEIATDFTESYLEEVARGSPPPAGW